MTSWPFYELTVSHVKNTSSRSIWLWSQNTICNAHLNFHSLGSMHERQSWINLIRDRGKRCWSTHFDDVIRTVRNVLVRPQDDCVSIRVQVWVWFSYEFSGFSAIYQNNFLRETLQLCVKSHGPLTTCVPSTFWSVCFKLSIFIAPALWHWWHRLAGGSSYSDTPYSDTLYSDSSEFLFPNCWLRLGTRLRCELCI